jgi:hypothetical protein
LPIFAAVAPSRNTVARQYEHTAMAEAADLNSTCAPQEEQLLIFNVSGLLGVHE